VRDARVRISCFAQDTHGASETDGAPPDEKRESPLPGWASTKAATAAAEAAAAPTERARTKPNRPGLTKLTDDHVGGTDVSARSSLANASASRVHVMHEAQTPR